MEMLKPIVHGMRDEVKALSPAKAKTKAKADAEADAEAEDEVEGCAKSRCDS